MWHFFALAWGTVGFIISAAAGLFAFAFAREFVRKRLRYVDTVRSPIIPWVVAFLVAVVAMPVVALISFLHLIGGGTALLLGAASGLGTASGVKALTRGE